MVTCRRTWKAAAQHRTPAEAKRASVAHKSQGAVSCTGLCDEWYLVRGPPSTNHTFTAPASPHHFPDAYNDGSRSPEHERGSRGRASLDADRVLLSPAVVHDVLQGLRTRECFHPVKRQTPPFLTGYNPRINAPTHIVGDGRSGTARNGTVRRFRSCGQVKYPPCRSPARPIRGSPPLAVHCHCHSKTRDGGVCVCLRFCGQGIVASLQQIQAPACNWSRGRRLNPHLTPGNYSRNIQALDRAARVAQSRAST
jgi:hypothetical protein